MREELISEIVIVSYKRQEILLKTLESIRRVYSNIPICLGLQEEHPHGALSDFIENDQNIRIEYRERPSITQTLNQCIASSRSDVVLLLDDDSIPCEGWLESHLSEFTHNPRLLYTCGREIRVNKGFSLFARLTRIVMEALFSPFTSSNFKSNGNIIGYFNSLGILFGNFDQSGKCMINSPRGCNMGVRREPFVQSGGFDERFVGNGWGFETAFGLDHAKQGSWGRYVGDAIVLHYEANSGGSRQEKGDHYKKAYQHNNKLLMERASKASVLGQLLRKIKLLVTNSK